MKHPLQAIPQERRLPISLTLLALTVGLSTILSWTLRKERYGIVALEMAGDERKAREVIGSWGEGARSRALFNVHLDYLFLVAYSTTIGLVCLWGASVLRVSR